ncbi:VOC family protein [Streptomyces sp. NPDC005708]|uniref:VOC family protein n=1 Tax=Streptomyces sp. NPDC005708 TaxID=3154564 RepID=UPI0033C78370
MSQPQGEELQAILKRQKELRQQYLLDSSERTTSTSRGVHHAAFICRDVEETILFYQNVMGFPLVELIENGDYPGSTHFFFDLGNGNLLGFFDFPGHPHPDYAEAIGGIHHLALSVTSETFAALKARFDEQGIQYIVAEWEPAHSMFVADPNGLRLEISQLRLLDLGFE